MLVLILPGSLLLTINLPVRSLSQAGSRADGKDESLYSLTRYLDVPRAAQHQLSYGTAAH